LTLRSWNDETAAVFAFSRDVLLWRPVAGDEDAGYKNVPSKEGVDREAFDQHQQNSTWFQFPDKRQVGAKLSNIVTVVEVRPGLEVVIPHHDAVRMLVGPELFDSLKALSKGEDNSSAVGSVITTLGDALDSASSQQQQQQHQEQKHNDDPFVAYDDSTDIAVVVQAIAEEEKYDDDDMAPTLTNLKAKLIKSVHNLRVLEEEDVKGLNLPPVVFRYLIRVKKGQQ
jgi:hypothetical protein